MSLVLTAVAVTWLTAAHLCAAATSAKPPPAQVRDGQTTADFPAIGTVVTAFFFCTGILIGCETVLTAAHCVCPEDAKTYQECADAGAAAPADSHVFFPHVGFIQIASIAVDPEYDSFRAGDLAVLKLRQAVDGIAPLSVNTFHQPATGTSATIVGFGDADGSLGDGVKRTGTISISECMDATARDEFDCYRAMSHSTPSVCQGDSGGPLLADLGRGLVVTSVASHFRGVDDMSECEPPYSVYNTDTFFYRSFIRDQLGSDSSDIQCGDLPAVGAAGAEVRAFLGELDSAHPDVRGSFDVPAGTRLLRVTMNGERRVTAKGRNNFDLYLKAGSPPSSADFDCLDAERFTFGVCEVVNPEPGTWYASIERVEGEGEVQLTATLFESLAPATPTYTPTRGPTSTPRPPAEECVGDCNGDGRIAINELVRGVALALGNPATPCADFDPEGDGVGIAALVKAVNGALYGCLSA